MTSPTGTEARVCADIAARQALGTAKYGVTVEANPLALRQWLQHAYEETLDQAIYLRRAIEEIDRTERAAIAAVAREDALAHEQSGRPDTAAITHGPVHAQHFWAALMDIRGEASA